MKSHLQTTRAIDKKSPKSYRKVVNETKVGNHIGYTLMPGSVAGSLLWEDDHEQIRGGFSNYNVWVAPLYVDQAHEEDNLAQWTLWNREIEDKDIVLWYTLGFHHVPLQEDCPIMPTISNSFLRPANFFEHNPVLKLKSPKLVKWLNCSA
ncbi:hypothetical protein ACJIZ3_021607 [Penstemon smallii]|uniref:Amine oxidase n=1 Tax=Penstemon smallii TaxID=265156 RepID=A0ABD3SM32_9LAMI